jgi:glutamate racemase
MIGVLDSGLGGLSAARMLSRLAPLHTILYFGDTAKGPYGDKSPETIQAFALDAARFLVEHGARMIAVACHDISAVAMRALMEKFTVGFVDTITPAVKRALSVSRKKSIGVIASRAVVESGAYEKRLKAFEPDAKVYSKACPLLSALVRECRFKKPETNMIVKKCIQPLKVRQIDALVAGSSDFWLLTDVVCRKAGKRISVVDPSSTFAEYLAEYLDECSVIGREPESKPPDRFYVSDRTPRMEKIARIYYGKNIRLEKVAL